MLDVSIAALKSLLQRARAELEQQTTLVEEHHRAPRRRTRSVLDRYMTAFEQSDMHSHRAAAREDAILEISGTTTWFSGKTTCVPFIANQAIGQAGDSRMTRPRRTASSPPRPTTATTTMPTTPSRSPCWPCTQTHLTRISLFADPALFERFDLPTTIAAT